MLYSLHILHALPAKKNKNKNNKKTKQPQNKQNSSIAVDLPLPMGHEWCAFRRARHTISMN